MPPTPPTVVSLKQDFLTAQTRLLSQPLAPSRAWRSANDESPEGLPEKAIDETLFKLNHRLQQHSRRVYAPQATRHVAEQIDQLYWDSALAAKDGLGDDDGNDGDGDGDGSGQGRGVFELPTVGADLADPQVIKTLPAAWDAVSTRQVEAYPTEARRYGELAARLRERSSQREEAAARVARVRRMRALLEPFDDAAGVQENLVTRNGEVEAELQRMRTLLARVSGRVSQLREHEGEKKGSGGDVTDVDGHEQRKVGRLLETF